MLGETYGQDLLHDATTLHNASCLQEKQDVEHTHMSKGCATYKDFAVTIRSRKTEVRYSICFIKTNVCSQSIDAGINSN